VSTIIKTLCALVLAAATVAQTQTIGQLDDVHPLKHKKVISIPTGTATLEQGFVSPYKLTGATMRDSKILCGGNDISFSVSEDASYERLLGTYSDVSSGDVLTTLQTSRELLVGETLYALPCALTNVGRMSTKKEASTGYAIRDGELVSLLLSDDVQVEPVMQLPYTAVSVDDYVFADGSSGVAVASDSAIHLYSQGECKKTIPLGLMNIGKLVDISVLGPNSFLVTSDNNYLSSVTQIDLDDRAQRLTIKDGKLVVGPGSAYTVYMSSDLKGWSPFASVPDDSSETKYALPQTTVAFFKAGPYVSD
jgi:hypothetical protein